ncbi:response regulator transcription factor [Aequorivita vladivostokensis]|uniref:Ligand-binding protein SH3 n=1 Tax=Aequorivita vladivostokensis TaxID=171194 RepID=A0ABR5DJE4_9FLAO|nr:response regulator transcription factor [Aequorivita vladivostokensis]KJJ38902.1 ligand-binding protein SH3 [Aequorivita vladivostokensis]MAB57434.1 DNA-binding response regulator [Aequorivita sp.]MBF30707.1 DNA-binding response regulator [Aequorivita sp.]HBL78664.1 DNA-binding response regulator [Aequorivita sp.]|tara:strand:- start:67083 stop:67736 length:654 start_codon:yes stop_codon:yes gene_type:complete
MNSKEKHTVAIVDDHSLFARSLEKLINSFPNFTVLFHAKNGLQLQQKIEKSNVLPDIILLDINMPVMNGFETAEWLADTHPGINVLALSMEDEEQTILKMLRRGVKGYLLKDIHPEILNTALEELQERGYYHSEKVSETLLHSLTPDEEGRILDFKENELTFIKLACSEMTYKEIANIMDLSPKTIDGYRQDLFKRLKIKNRVGLVIFALKKKLIQL